MKYLIFLLIISTILGCTKHYSNEECVKEVCKRLKCDEANLPDQAMAQIGASFACADNNNDPDQAVKAFEGNHD